MCRNSGDAFVVGTSVARSPRTDPDERASRIRLLPRVFDGEADASSSLSAALVGQDGDAVLEPEHPPLRAQRTKRAAAGGCSSSAAALEDCEIGPPASGVQCGSSYIGGYAQI
jgi:hypothetical protein